MSIANVVLDALLLVIAAVAGLLGDMGAAWAALGIYFVILPVQLYVAHVERKELLRIR